MRGSIVYVAVDGGNFDFVRASSGVVVDQSGLVLCWKHQVQEAIGSTENEVYVQLDDANNTRVPATIAQVDDASGLALLRIQPSAAGIAAATLGPDRARAGEPLVVLARPEGKEVLAFSGVASPALAAVTVRGKPLPLGDVFLTDARNDDRCDGAPIFDADGHLLGLYCAEHVQRQKSEPTLEDLQRPSFGFAIGMGAVRKAFAKSFAAAKQNPSLVTAPAASADPFVAAVAKVSPAVVSVWAGEGEWPVLDATDPGAVRRRAGLASGVVLSARGLVVTNSHAVTGSAARVRTGDGRTFPAKVQKRSGDTNLALLQVELPAGASLVAADCNPDDDAILGEHVLAVGNPLGTAVVVTAGVVSARRGREGGRIQADPNLGNQNGGGAVVDATGRLLGIADAGVQDPIEMAFAMRGDKATTETNLSTFVSIGRVRKVFAGELAAAGEQEPIRAPVPPTAAQRQLRTPPLVAMAEKVRGALLNIYIARNVAKQDENDPFASMAEPVLVPLGMGSGVIIDPTGLAISNWHVVDEATEPDGSMRNDHALTASVFGGKTYKVKVLSISREDDLSLLQLELAPGETVPAVELGSSDGLAIGESVAAIGNPHGRANTITYGIVSAKGQATHVKGRFEKLRPLIETDAAINGGNSGGALLDMAGRLVGINSAGGGTFNNVGFAIEVDHVRRQLLGLLLQPYKLRSPELGLRVLDDEGEVVVMDVDTRGPASAAGVLSGDRIVSLGGVKVKNSPEFAMVLRAASTEQPLDLAVLRKGAAKTFSLQPLAAEAWSVVRQSGLLCRNYGFREDPDRVRAAVTALHRQLSSDPTAEPSVIPEQVVIVSKVFAEGQAQPTDIQAGDLLLALELQNVNTGEPVFVRPEQLAKLRDLWNARDLGTYDGLVWKCWIARGTEIRTAELTVKRLFW